MSIIINGTGTISGVSATGLTTAQTVTQSAIATGVAGTGPAFSVYQNSAQTALPAATATKLVFQAEEFDTNTNFDNTTNYRFTPTVAGYYQVNGAIQLNGTTNALLIYLFKNGSAYKQGTYISPSASATTGSPSSIVSSLVYLNGSTDYIELYAYTVASLPPIAGLSNTYFNGSMTRAA